jgi:spermidine/putrescine transport system substrate-binding protein
MSRSLFHASAILPVTLLLAVALSTSLSCTRKSAEQAPNLDETPSAKGSESQAKELNLAIWANYLSPEVQDEFQKQTGIQLKISNYSSNEELLAKVQAGASGIDVAVPSDYMVEVMIKQDLLQPLDSAKLPNKAGLDPSLLKQEYDPENRFSLPYGWSTAGIAVNRDLYKGPIKSWKDLFENKELAGKISLLDDVREVAGAVLKMQGQSVNTTDSAALDKAKATLKAARTRVKMFRSDTIDPLVNKEVAVAHAFSSDAFQAARKTGGKIEYILPEEGGTRAIDNIVILKSAANAENAHKLINFLMSKEANVAFVKATMGGPVLTATKDSLPEDLKSNAALFPPPAVLSKFERIKDVGDATKAYDRLWTEIKAE